MASISLGIVSIISLNRSASNGDPSFNKSFTAEQISFADFPFSRPTSRSVDLKSLDETVKSLIVSLQLTSNSTIRENGRLVDAVNAPTEVEAAPCLGNSNFCFFGVTGCGWP